MNLTFIILLGIVKCSTETAQRGVCRNVNLGQAKSQNDTGGIFEYNITGVGMMEIYCDVKTDGGNWIVFQRRLDGRVDFHRDWADYVKGFGQPTADYWLGLEAIHQLTKSGKHELRIELMEKNGTQYYAKYSSFRIGPSSSNYTINVSGYSGNATDSMGNSTRQYSSIHNQPFSTRDADNDGRSAKNCALSHAGGWWYNNCVLSNLNRDFANMLWRDQFSARKMQIAFAEMKFREMQ